MRGLGNAALLLPIAAATVFVADVLWPSVVRLGHAVSHWSPLAALRRRAGRLPVAVALPLFLIPEVCSRLGWVMSVWLALDGQPWRGLAVYCGTKLIAGSLAWWICSACLPVLMRVRVFAAGHAALLAAQGSVTGWLRERPAGPFAAAVARQRAARLRVRS